MALIVRLHVYSGVPDPVWALTADQATNLRRMISTMDATSVTADRGLGYRGFSILDPEPSEGHSAMLFDSADSDPVSGSFVAGNPEVEDYLLWTGSGLLNDDVADHVRSAISSPMARPMGTVIADVSCPPCGGADAPIYNPSYWNGDVTRKRDNNCYNYANDQATNTFAQPGRHSRRDFVLSCGSVQPAAETDGLKSVPTFHASIPSGWYVVLVVWPGTDFHWYRQDSSGCWSHKPGQTPVRDVDNSGARILDPRTADRGPYTSFCSYMVTNRHVRIV